MSSLSTTQPQQSTPNDPQPPSRPQPPTHVLETCLYVRSMRDAVSFYRDILGLSPALEAQRITVFPMGTTSLILFQLGMTEKDSREISAETGEEFVVAGHGPDRGIVDVLMAEEGGDVKEGNGSGARLRTHYCLAVGTKEEVRAWEGYLRGKDVKVRGVMEWKRGGRSVYFEDVDGHVGEIGSRGIWEHY